MFLGGLWRSLDQFLVTAAFALPERIHRCGIGSVLVDGAIGRNNLAATYRTGTAAGSSLLDINIL
jgi:hypothetical protein